MGIKVWAVLGAVLALAVIAPAPAGATATVSLEATYSSGIANGWVRVERYRDTSTGFVAETYPPDGRGDQTGQTQTFFGGVAQPHSSRFLLYHAPGWATGANPVPVLLVHGANQTADQAWANPNSNGSFGCGDTSCPSTGLMQDLDARGYKVFAIGFPHRNGDGYYWAFNARQYVSSVKRSWATAYAGDVRKLILLGNPNKGFDWGYRHGWTHDFAIFPECGGSLNAPAPHTDMVCYGLWRHHPELSYEGTAFPGSGQMLARWDSVYPLPTTEQDWYTTYYGGTGFYTAGQGIQWVIDRQSLVSTIVAAGTPASVGVYELCGSSPTMVGLHNEHTGPSDGAVFIASCAAPDGIANRVASTTLALNHLELGWQSAARSQIASWLG
jgi:hypothetical protein